MIVHTVKDAIRAIEDQCDFVIYNGRCQDLISGLPEQAIDLTVTSPPYFMGKAYEKSYDLQGFIDDHTAIAAEISNITKEGGSIAWQVGHHVRNGVCTPLDFLVYGVFSQREELTLRNRIVWTFNHGLHATKRLSGRHETILWFTKGSPYYFELDAIRVPQKYPGKRYYSGPKKGQWSGNPLGKNPGDVWEIPNVKANHIEKTIHPCQFPVGLVERLVKSMCPEEGVVFDPFCGVGSSGIAAAMNNRRFIGAETDINYCNVAQERYSALKHGKLRTRPLNKPVYEPDENSSVAKRPAHFATGD